MSAYLISAEGCDDVTEVVMDLKPAEAAVVARVAAAITAEGGGCRPTLHLSPAPSTTPES